MRKLMFVLMLAMSLGAVPAQAQVRTIDPNQPIDGDLNGTQRMPPARDPAPAEPDRDSGPSQPYADSSPPPPPSQPPEPARNVTGVPPVHRADTYQQDDLLAAGTRAFGKGAAGLGGLLERILKDQGEPNAYIVGREGSGAIALGLRYGSGTLSHKVEGDQPIFWTGPSLGFDLGGDATKVFVLVYNLYDTEDAFKRFPAAEGRLYFVGGFSATYQRRGNIVLIPVRLGVGWRAGVNIGYTKYTHTSKWMPF